ncbi:MAG: hypothetical protein Q8P30_02450 [Candidatus Uhrbacteria bacterium]|nr:hypothetical protein [Candidatus Uhrbacteria bacterium]
MKKILSFLWRGVLGFFSGIIAILSLPPVRNFIWSKTLGKGKKKIVEAQAKVVDTSGSTILRERSESKDLSEIPDGDKKEDLFN